MSTEAVAPAPIERLVESVGTITLTGVSDEIAALLDAELDPKRVKQIRGNDYIPEHDIVRTANRIFGYGRWGTTVLWHECVGSAAMKNRDGDDGWYTGYRCCVRLTVVGCEAVDGIGYGDAFEKQWSAQITTHELASKEAESDAIKRAFKKWGDQFGLILWAKKEDKQRIAAEKAQTEYDAHASDDAIRALGVLAHEKGKGDETTALLVKEQESHDGHVRSGRLAEIRVQLEAMPVPGSEPKPAPEAAAKTDEVEQLLAIHPPDRPATEDEVSALISSALKIDVDAASKMTELVLAHRKKTVGNVVSFKWLTAAQKKVQERIDGPSPFEPPNAATATATDDEVAAAFAGEQAA